jgi:hypothetical protein
MQKKTHIKKGDMVKVLAGEDRSKQGRVLEVDRVKDASPSWKASTSTRSTASPPRPTHRVASWRRRAPSTSAT